MRHSRREFMTTAGSALAALAPGLVLLSMAAAQQPNPPYPDVSEMSRGLSEKEFRDGTIVCGWEALRHRMRNNIYRTNIGRLDAPQLTQFERLVAGDPDDVAAVNREIVEFCRKRQAEIEEAWRDPKREHPAKEVCNYQVELIPLAVIALRIGERLTPETRQAIKDVLAAFRPEAAGVEPGLWLHAPGYNGGNPHDTLSMLALTWELTRNPDTKEAAYWGLRGELENLSRSDDMQEFNLLEGHWCSTKGYDVMKAYLSDPELARMARLMGERIWLNRFLTWSPAVERITGPGSRMAPGAWLGTSGDRLQFATGVEKPIWVNEYFDWAAGPGTNAPAGGSWTMSRAWCPICPPTCKTLPSPAHRLVRGGRRSTSSRREPRSDSRPLN